MAKADATPVDDTGVDTAASDTPVDDTDAAALQQETAPDGPGPASATEGGSYDPAALVKADEVRVEISAEDLETYGLTVEADDQAGALRGLYTAGLKVAGNLKAALARVETGYTNAAMWAIALRQSVVRKNGVPDWFGATQAYKVSLKVFLDVATATFPQKRVSVRNGVQKAVTRKASDGYSRLDRQIIAYVVAHPPEGGWVDLVEGAEHDHPGFRGAVLRQYDLAKQGADENQVAPPPADYRAAETQASPGPQGEDGTGGTAVAPGPEAVREQAASLREVIADNRLPLDETALALFQTAQAFYRAITPPNAPHWGAGREVVADTNACTMRLLQLAGKVLTDVELSAGEQGEVTDLLK